jgi:hypothetical protein
VALRIAFDMDGVFADMDAELVRQAEILFGQAVAARPPEPADPSPGGSSPPAQTPQSPTPDHEIALARLQMTSRQQRQLWSHVESIENFWETLREIEAGSVRKLSALASARGWEVIFLTKRPRSGGAIAQIQTQRWLQSKGFGLPSVFVVQGSRGRIASALDLDFVIDDRPENCLDVVMESKSQAILVWRDRETPMLASTRRLGIGVVKSVTECLDALAEVDSPDLERPSIVDRVMRLLGLRPQGKSST